VSKMCSNVNCFVHDGESCADGNITPSECENYCNEQDGNNNKAGSQSPSNEIDDFARVPWSGNSLGLADLVSLSPRAQTILVGVIGAHDAGKTTLLLGSYFNCLRGNNIANAEFAGSRTLGAWESLASWSRFDDAARLPNFPPHTPRGANRTPGLLHLALRRKTQKVRDVLLADAPGEWFSSWAVNEMRPTLKGLDG